MLKKLLSLSVGVFCLTLSAQAQAFWIKDATTASGQNFRPAVDESLYVTMYGSQNLQKKQFHSGLFFNYARKPLEIGAVGPTVNTTIRDLVWVDVFGAVGLTDWFEIGLDVPAAPYEVYLDRNVKAPTPETVYGLGDVQLEMKFRLLDIHKYNVGLALRPFVTIPTGNGDKYIGNNSFTGGGTFIADFDIADRFQMAVNAGYLARDNYQISGRNIRIDDQFIYGAGASWRAFDRLTFVAEAYGATTIVDFFDLDRDREIPVEVDGALKIFPIETLAITVGGGAGLTKGYGAPLYRGFVGLGYTRASQVELELAPMPEAPKPEPLAYIENENIVITKKVHFEFGSTQISEISFPILQAVVDVMNENRQLRLVQVEGHTDSIGSKAGNLKLSQRRADSVRQWLVEHGVEADRLLAKGMGMEHPIDTNDTAIGRAINRRVAFTILNQD